MLGSFKKFIDAQFAPNQNDFDNKGTLTPDQFIEAGDQLINFGWKWQPSLNKPSKLLTNPKKQFLTTQAESKSRIKQLLQEELNQQTINSQGFMEVTGSSSHQQNKQKYRHYTVYITYNQYYHTPHLWIKGTNISGKPLSSDEIFEDIYAEYQDQTVTKEMNPFLQCQMLNIHPCKHSDVMKKFIQESKSRNKKIKPFQSLIIFLKFMKSVMPTVKYDQSQDFD